jgi:hypothetical protein
MGLIFVFLALALSFLFEIVKIIMVILEWIFGGGTNEKSNS